MRLSLRRIARTRSLFSFRLSPLQNGVPANTSSCCWYWVSLHSTTTHSRARTHVASPPRLAGLVAGYLLQTLRFERKDGTPLCFEVELFEKVSCSRCSATSDCCVDPLVPPYRAQPWVWTARQFQWKLKEDHSDSTRLCAPSMVVSCCSLAPVLTSSHASHLLAGSHSNVFRLYKHLDIALRRSDFSYSFSRLARIPPRPTSPPPPPYSERAPTPSSDELPPPPQQTPRFIYEGSNGMTFPPLALPSPIASASPFGRLSYLFHLVLLSLSYLHLLLLAFFHSSAGLTRRSSSPAARASTARRIADALRLPNVSDEPVEAWCGRHWLWSGMVEEVLVPLYAAVSTVGRIEAREMPVGECLGQSSALFQSTTTDQVSRRLHCVDFRFQSLRRRSRSPAGRPSTRRPLSS